MRDYIILNGVNSNTISGLLISTLPSISKPKIRTQTEEIDGRDGDIVTKLGYSAYDKEIEIGLYGNYDTDEVIEYFKQFEDSIQKSTSGKEIAELNKQIEDKINYLLGYEASKDLFKEPITATTVFGNGQVFTCIVLDKIAEAIAKKYAPCYD